MYMLAVYVCVCVCFNVKSNQNNLILFSNCMESLQFARRQSERYKKRNDSNNYDMK